jgi:hypothetical protein
VLICYPCKHTLKTYPFTFDLNVFWNEMLNFVLNENEWDA